MPSCEHTSAHGCVAGDQTSTAHGTTGERTSPETPVTCHRLCCAWRVEGPCLPCPATHGRSVASLEAAAGVCSAQLVPGRERRAAPGAGTAAGKSTAQRADPQWQERGPCTERQVPAVLPGLLQGCAGHRSLLPLRASAAPGGLLPGAGVIPRRRLKAPRHHAAGISTDAAAPRAHAGSGAGQQPLENPLDPHLATVTSRLPEQTGPCPSAPRPCCLPLSRPLAAPASRIFIVPSLLNHGCRRGGSHSITERARAAAQFRLACRKSSLRGETHPAAARRLAGDDGRLWTICTFRRG